MQSRSIYSSSWLPNSRSDIRSGRDALEYDDLTRVGLQIDDDMLPQSTPPAGATDILRSSSSAFFFRFYHLKVQTSNSASYQILESSFALPKNIRCITVFNSQADFQRSLWLFRLGLHTPGLGSQAYRHSAMFNQQIAIAIADLIGWLTADSVEVPRLGSAVV